jgi:glucan phosphoethanolaminetransferase (alkaline phosphatase superfamily)
MKLALTFCVAFIAAALVFAVYFCCVAHLFPFGRSLAEFSAMFQPLEALFTALAFIAIVIISYAQSKELRQTKRDTAEAFVRASRLQASGARLISMATQNDPNLAAARRELEQQVEELEQWLERYLRQQA